MKTFPERQPVMKEKIRHPLPFAQMYAQQIVESIRSSSERIIIAGSIRRGRPEVGDIEIVYIPGFFKDATQDFFESKLVNAMDVRLQELLDMGFIKKRLRDDGAETWGEKNKLAVHVQSGIPVDFFATNDACWHNYLVCRTGGALNNQQIALAAQRKGWKWHPYGPGFSDNHGDLQRVHSEQDVYRLVDMCYIEPQARV